MRISEIFYSVRGEGELTGVPSVFVGTDAATLRVGEAVALEACKAHVYRFCSRLHIHLFGHAEGT